MLIKQPVLHVHHILFPQGCQLCYSQWRLLVAMDMMPNSEV